jgi:hypothetical protein
MRRRFAFVWTLLAICVALALPASTVAGSRYRAVALWDECTTTGGLHGFGYAEQTIRATEMRRSGVNYFKFSTQAERLVAGRWTPVGGPMVEFSDRFPNSRASNSYTLFRHWDFDANSQFSYQRLVTKVQFRSDGGLIRTRTVIGTSC